LREPAVELALICRAQLIQLKSLPASCCSNVRVSESRSSGAIRSERAAGRQRPQSARNRTFTKLLSSFT
jgi:hypothetical protein